MAQTEVAVAPPAVEGELQVQQQAYVGGMLTNMVATLKENAAASFREAKPWGEVFDKNSFAKPAGSTEALGRLRKNFAYFRVNYGIVGVGTTALVMLLHPWSIVVLAILASVWFYAYLIRSTPFSFNGRELTDREKFLTLSVTSLVVVFLLTSVGTVLFYALGLSALVIGLHGALHVPDDLFLDEVPETQAQGLLSMFTGGASAALPPLRPPIATAV